MGSGNSRPVAPHVAAAMAGVGQCKPAVSQCKPAVSQCKQGAAAISPRPAAAPHVAAMIGRGGLPQVQRLAVPPPSQPAAAQRQPAPPQRQPARPLPPAARPQGAVPAGRAIQRMQNYVYDDNSVTSLRIVMHDPVVTTTDKKKRKSHSLSHGDQLDFELEGQSDDDDVEETAKNFFIAHRDLSNSFGSTRKLKAPSRSGHKKLRLSDNPSQWKRVNTEYIGEVGGFDTMIKKGYKMGFPTGVLGGKGLDQVWYKGSITAKTITEVVVVECKGPGAKLSATQMGKTSATLSRSWVKSCARVMSRSTDTRRKRLGKAILDGLDGNGVDLYGLIVSHTLDGDRKVGRMHRL